MTLSPYDIFREKGGHAMRALVENDIFTTIVLGQFHYSFFGGFEIIASCREEVRPAAR